MLQNLLAKMFGTKNEREVKKIRPIVEHINGLEAAIKALDDDQLRGKTAEFRVKLSQGAKPGHGGVLPAAKVTPEIAEARGVHPRMLVAFLGRRPPDEELPAGGERTRAAGRRRGARSDRA